jgi:hypothetical protein
MGFPGPLELFFRQKAGGAIFNEEGIASGIHNMIRGEGAGNRGKGNAIRRQGRNGVIPFKNNRIGIPGGIGFFRQLFQTSGGFCRRAVSRGGIGKIGLCGNPLPRASIMRA